MGGISGILRKFSALLYCANFSPNADKDKDKDNKNSIEYTGTKSSSHKNSDKSSSSSSLSSPSSSSSSSSPAGQTPRNIGERRNSFDIIGMAEVPMEVYKQVTSFPKAVAIGIVGGLLVLLWMFGYHATYVSSLAYSSPSIVIDAGRTPDGRRILFDDYREAYFWLRQNTDPNAKILSWWDYGYQMSAMANRTVIVDNNTWNNTHIATVGRALASTEEDSYPILESLDVDYVLVIFGGFIGYSSDDINKFLWPVRIGSGVFSEDMPSEQDFYSESGFDIGTGGSPYLHNCLAYKLCYHDFGKVQTDYSKPPGYDRARNKEIGNKNIVLTHLEEAFTSAQWIVRIYKVLPKPVAEPTEEYKKSVYQEKYNSLASTMNGGQQGGDSNKTPPVRYVGCFSSESAFVNKEYTGGSSGANIGLLKYEAMKKGKKMMAVAKSGGDGHAFIFDKIDSSRYPRGGDMKGEGCDRPCADDARHRCGCSDLYCEGPTPKGEEHNRRWVVYQF